MTQRYFGAFFSCPKLGSMASTEVFIGRETEHPMGRAGRPEEITNVILFLASEESSFVSGSTFVADGGA